MQSIPGCAKKEPTFATGKLAGNCSICSQLNYPVTHCRLRDRLKQLEERETSLELECDKLREELQLSSSPTTTQTERISELEAELVESEAELAKMKAELAKMEAGSAKTTADLAKTEAQLTELKQSGEEEKRGLREQVRNK